MNFLYWFWCILSVGFAAPAEDRKDVQRKYRISYRTAFLLGKNINLEMNHLFDFDHVVLDLLLLISSVKVF